MTARGFLDLVGHEDAALVSAKVDGLRRLVLGYGAARSWLWVLYGAQAEAGLLVLSALAMTGCAAFAWFPKRAHWAARAAAPVLLLQLAATFPFADNHFVLEVLVVVVLAAVGRNGEGETEVLQGVLWVIAIVLFQTGFQKALHGQYFQGEFLAFMVGRGGRFGDAFAWMLSPVDVEQLAAHDPLRSGAGPYRVDSTVFVVVSNLVWVAEIALAGLLLWTRTRAIAAIVSIAFVLALQLGAREVGFALLFSCLLLSFFENDLGRKVVPFVLVFLVWVVLTAAGVLPGGQAIDPGWM